MPKGSKIDMDKAKAIRFAYWLRKKTKIEQSFYLALVEQLCSANTVK